MFVTHLESALDGTRFEAGRVHTVHQGRPLWVRYDLAAAGAAVTPAGLAGRPPSLWRYRELLPPRPRGHGTGGLVRRVHAQGAVPAGGREDDGAGTGRAVGLAPARRHPVPDRRRDRPDRHVEGVRGTATARLAEVGQAAAAGQ